MKRISNYIPKLLDKYFITKKGNIYAKQYDVRKYIKIINLRKKGYTYKEISKQINEISQTSIFRIVKSHPKPLYKKLKLSKDKDGYLKIGLYNENKNQKDFGVHRIMGYCYLQLTDDKQINHKNGIKDDNRLENLEVVTQSENMKHAVHVLGFDCTKNLPNNKNL